VLIEFMVFVGVGFPFPDRSGFAALVESDDDGQLDGGRRYASAASSSPSAAKCEPPVCTTTSPGAASDRPQRGEELIGRNDCVCGPLLVRSP
jgi:hypothetical protein